MFADDLSCMLLFSHMNRSIKRLHWRWTLRLTAGLLVIWFAVTFLVSYYARELDFSFFGWPFSFWMAAQGSLLLYVCIIAIYAWIMGKLDKAAGDADSGDEA